MTYHLESGAELNSFITPFVLHIVFQNVGLSWIIDNNKHIKFEMDVEDSQFWFQFQGILEHTNFHAKGNNTIFIHY